MTPRRSEARCRALRRAAPIGAAAALSLALAAHAEVVVNEDEFRDWIGRCETETTTGEVLCFIYTGRVAEVDGEALAARIVVGIGDNLGPIVYLEVPDTAEPAAGFMLQVDQREPFNGLFSTCSTGWCHTQAAGEIAQLLIDQFRAGSQATASFVLEGTSVRIDMPLSLMGFTAAYTQLVAIHQQAMDAAAEDAAAAAEAEAAAAAAAEEEAAGEAADAEAQPEDADAEPAVDDPDTADVPAEIEEPVGDDTVPADEADEPAAQ
ncbi:MAG: invasion associated locus B family protein [Alphaproteobacteria bacterium]